ncbi:indolepyruvate ferredoxin oxidoreductase beta subunit [Fervidobacterium changbaicum]|uniref:2-oxoacid:acceptor oxidoreductase family protein n=2 Tax=Fervidobacterium TaxID=2422 RepID=A0AAI8CKQ4_FERIS|nr:MULTISPECIES: 2-oxoacid:acceptor oxidoreductase family protein [Fervidobacterium]AMW32166.1 2-oxoacid:acceptor oxidoreductase family protein [Fervidobacterium islandicum]QAV33937.1 pyruvate ferredoxin oxidoreductase [Fervidobacterium changbaicum]SDH56593.1 indolepyruvate ferredoxin oxidoreductase beta subunit [Fervidobacterium changbaicum]
MTKFTAFNIFLIGVGGQGIGLLSEILIRAIDYSGQRCIGVDTHGLAQRGGVVSSHIKIGDVNSPLVLPGDVNLALALERHEAARALNYLKDNGILVYYNTSWQPLPVRLGKEPEIKEEEIESTARQRNISVFKVKYALPDSRMQNIALLGVVAKNNLVPGVEPKHYLMAMEDLMSERVYSANKEIFESILEAR